MCSPEELMATGHGSSTRKLTIGVILLLQLAGMAQTPAKTRWPHPGRVLDARGQPVAGARVVFASQGREDAFRDHPRHDIVRVTTRADGRFHADIDPQLDYLAWAVMSDRPGAVVCRPVEVGIAPVELRFAADDVAPDTAIEVRGLAAWRALGRLRLRAVPLACGVPAIEGQLDATDALPLPPLPRFEKWLLLFFLGDRLVHDMVTESPASVELPPPRSLQVRVLGADGRPNGNAALERVATPHDEIHPMRIKPMRAGRFYAASTALDGTAELLVAADRDPRTHPVRVPIVFLAASPGHVETTFGLSKSPFVAGNSIRGPAALAPLEVTLAAAPAAARPLHVRVDPKIALRASGALDIRTGDGVLIELRLAWELTRNGDFASLAHLPEEVTPQAIELDQHVLQLAPDDRFARAPVVAVPALPIAALQGERPFRPEQLQPLRLQIMEAEAGPAQRALVLAMPELNGQAVNLAYAMRARTDMAGRLVLPVTPGRLLVIATTDKSWAKAWLQPGRDTGPTKLTLQPMACIDLRVVDTNGVGAPGATFRVGTSIQRGGEPEQPGVVELARAIAHANVERLRANAEGRAQLYFPADPRVSITIIGKFGSRYTAPVGIPSPTRQIELRLD